jgi:hypothetical protein
MEQAEKLGHQQFANLFIDRITELVRHRPAYLSLVAAPVPTCCKKGLVRQNRECLSSKEPIALGRTFNFGCKSSSPDGQGLDEALCKGRA